MTSDILKKLAKINKMCAKYLFSWGGGVSFLNMYTLKYANILC